MCVYTHTYPHPNIINNRSNMMSTNTNTNQRITHTRWRSSEFDGVPQWEEIQKQILEMDFPYFGHWLAGCTPQSFEKFLENIFGSSLFLINVWCLLWEVSCIDVSLLYFISLTPSLWLRSMGPPNYGFCDKWFLLNSLSHGFSWEHHNFW